MPALSGGMRSRVGCAGTAMNPEIMRTMERTSPLDPIMTDKINDLIVSLRDRLADDAQSSVTHDISSAYKIADRIAMIHEGRILSAARPPKSGNPHNPYIQLFIRASARCTMRSSMKRCMRYRLKPGAGQRESRLPNPEWKLPFPARCRPGGCPETRISRSHEPKDKVRIRLRLLRRIASKVGGPMR